MVLSVKIKRSGYVPLDFIKGELIQMDLQKLLDDPKLNFTERVNIITGEVLSSKTSKGVERSPRKEAFFKNIRFVFYTRTKRMFISGSLHTFSNNGEHNSNDFSQKEFGLSLSKLKSLFLISPKNLKISQLEWGVNVTPSTNLNNLINHCLFHKWKRFELRIDSKEGKYHQSEHNDYLVKLYNKSSQFGLEQPLIRFERKQIKYSKYCKQNGIGQTLFDLIESDYKGLRSTLLSDWSEVLMFDPDLDVFKKYRDVIFWIDLSKKSRTTRKKHFDRLRRLNEAEGGNHQQLMQSIIKEKIDALASKRVTKSHFNYNEKPFTPKRLELN